jgi:Flp pilus assembly protein TadB
MGWVGLGAALLLAGSTAYSADQQRKARHEAEDRMAEQERRAEEAKRQAEAQRKAAEEKARLEAEKRRRNLLLRGRASTFHTGFGGLTNPAPVQRKTLLGQ